MQKCNAYRTHDFIFFKIMLSDMGIEVHVFNLSNSEGEEAGRSRPAWPKERVTGQPGLHKEISPSLSKTKQRINFNKNVPLLLLDPPPFNCFK